MYQNIISTCSSVKYINKKCYILFSILSSKPSVDFIFTSTVNLRQLHLKCTATPPPVAALLDSVRQVHKKILRSYVLAGQSPQNPVRLKGS